MTDDSGFPSEWVAGDLPGPGAARTGRGGGAQRAASRDSGRGWLAQGPGQRARPSDGLVVLPKAGLQKFERQVVSGDDPDDLGRGEKDPSHLPSQTQQGKTKE